MYVHACLTLYVPLIYIAAYRPLRGFKLLHLYLGLLDTGSWNCDSEGNRQADRQIDRQTGRQIDDLYY